MHNDEEERRPRGRRWGFLDTVFEAVIQEFSGCLISAIAVIVIAPMVYLYGRFTRRPVEATIPEHKIMILAEEGRIPNEERLLRRLREEGFTVRVLRSMPELLAEMADPPTCSEILFAEYVTWCRGNPGRDECNKSIAQCYIDCDRCRYACSFDISFSMIFLAESEDVSWMFNPHRGVMGAPNGASVSVDAEKKILRLARMWARTLTHIPPERYF